MPKFAIVGKKSPPPYPPPPLPPPPRTPPRNPPPRTSPPYPLYLPPGIPPVTVARLTSLDKRLASLDAEASPRTSA